MSLLSRFLVFVVLCPIAACTSDRGGGGGGTAGTQRQLAQACARLSGCTSLSAAACETAISVLGLDDSATSCVLAAADCDAATACINAGAPAMTCTTSTFCDGDVIRGCSAGVTVARDCGAEGLSCLEDAISQVFCGRSDPCTSSSCEGNLLLSCINNFIKVQDCGADTCVDPGSPGFPACVPPGEPCTGFVFRCDGDVAVSCRSGVLHREPCGPGLCSTGDGVYCLPNPDCSPARCDGAVLVSCVDGVPERTDCTQWGFTACIVGASGATCASGSPAV